MCFNFLVVISVKKPPGINIIIPIGASLAGLSLLIIAIAGAFYFYRRNNNRAVENEMIPEEQPDVPEELLHLSGEGTSNDLNKTNDQRSSIVNTQNMILHTHA